MQAETVEALLAHALALEKAGDWDAASGAYARVFRISAKSGDLPGVIEALRGSVGVRRAQGKLDDAEDLAELRRQIAERNGLSAEAARATHMLGVICYERGDLNGAKLLYRKAADSLQDVGDDRQLGITYQNLGVIANIQGDFQEARILYLESIACAVRTGSALNAMMVYSNLGLVCADLRNWLEAEVYFDRGIEIAEQIGHLPASAKLHANKAEPLIHTGRVVQARRTLDTAEELATRVQDKATLADIARFRSIIAREEDDFSAAEQHIARSLQLAVETGLDLEHAEASEEHACLLAAQGRIGEAIETLRCAQDGFRVLGAERDVARTQETLDSLLSAAGPHFTPSEMSV